MSTTPEPDAPRPPAPTVFLSYASEDRPAAQSLRDALPVHGVEVWYDETELTGGDAWDQKIRAQIRECDFFIPVISSHTEARHEGYFRREWRLAVERSLDMADDHLFLLPVVIDDTPQASARVPEKFLQVQWTKVPGGRPNPAFEALCRRMLAGDALLSASARAARTPRTHPPGGAYTRGAGLGAGMGAGAGTTGGAGMGAQGAAAAAAPGVEAYTAGMLPFPREEPGQRARFLVEVLVWAVHSAWLIFQRLPKWARWIIGMYVFVAALSNCHGNERHSDQLSSADRKKLQAIAANFEGKKPGDIAQLASQVAHEFVSPPMPPHAGPAPLLAIPFVAPAEDETGRRLADATFAQVYGRMAISHHGYATLLEATMLEVDDQAALEHARSQHARYVLFGLIEGADSEQRLTVKMLKVADGSVIWSGSYPTASADPAAIAGDVDRQVHEAEDDQE